MLIKCQSIMYAYLNSQSIGYLAKLQKKKKHIYKILLNLFKCIKLNLN